MNVEVQQLFVDSRARQFRFLNGLRSAGMLPAKGEWPKNHPLTEEQMRCFIARETEQLKGKKLLVLLWVCTMLRLVEIE